MLKRLLLSLSSQSVPHNEFEIIVVNDGSVDNTEAVCSDMRKQLPNLKYLCLDTNLGLSAARNRGIEASKGQYLVFTDDDCIASNKWIEHMRNAMDKEEIVAGSIASPEGEYFKLCHNIAQFYPFMYGQKPCYKDWIAGANMGFLRRVLNDLGGFNGKMKCAEDTEIILRARVKGCRIFFEPDAVVIHDPERTAFSDIVIYAAKHAQATIRLRNQYNDFLKTPVIFRRPILLLLAAPAIAFALTLRTYLRHGYFARMFWTAPVFYLLKLAWCWGAVHSLWSKNAAQK